MANEKREKELGTLAISTKIPPDVIKSTIKSSNNNFVTLLAG